MDQLLRVVVLGGCLLTLLSSPLWAAKPVDSDLTGGGALGCSLLPAPQRANINELYKKTGSVFFDFIEIKILQDDTDIAPSGSGLSPWKLCYARNGKEDCELLGQGEGVWDSSTNPERTDNASSAGTTLFPANTWITYAGLRPSDQDGEVVLLDGSGNVLDYLAYTNNLDSCASLSFWTVPASCGSCFDSKSPSDKDLARLGPDGTGGWDNNGDSPSPQQDNLSSSIAAEWRLDEKVWSGVADEVIDSSSSFHGTAMGVSPVPGQVCLAADLSRSGTSDYLSMNAGALDGATDFTLSVWVKTANSGSQVILSGANSSEYNELLMGFTNATTFTPVLKGAAGGDIRVTSIADNQWHYLVWTRSGSQSCLYRDALLQGCSTQSSAALSIAAGGLIIGQLQGDLGGGFLATQGWEGLVDEPMIFQRPLMAAEIDSIYANQRAGKGWDGGLRDCPVSSVVLEVLARPSASTCVASGVRINALTPEGAIDTSYVGTIDLTTSSGHGNWALGRGNGVLTPNPHNSDNGIVRYSFVAADQGSVTLNLSNAHADRIRITATESSSRVTGTSELLSFSDNVIVICEPGSGYVDCSNNSPLPSPGYDLVAGRDHALRAELWQKDTTTGLCSIASGYNNKDFKAWLTRSPGDAGGVAPQLVGISTPTLPDSQPAANNLQLDFVSGQASFLWRTTDVGWYYLSLLDDSGSFAQDENGNPLPIGGDSVDWSVRPFGFYLAALGNMALIGSASEPVYRKAGAGFDIRVTAVRWQSADDLDGDGHPDGHADTDPGNNADLSDNAPTPAFGNEGETATLSAYLVAPAGGTDPGLSGVAGASGFVGGSATAAGARYTEVGLVELSSGLTSGGYQLSGIDLNGRSGYVGRFVPARLAVMANLPILSDQCSGFSYMDADLDFAVPPTITLTAQNSAGGETKNYNHDFWKLSTLLESRSYHNAASTAISSFSYVSGATASLWTGVSVADGSGSLTLANDRVRYGRSALQGPFDARIELLLSATDLTDADGICYLLDTNTDLDYLDETLCQSYTLADIGGTELQFGRLRVENGLGPETEAIGILAQTEFFNGVSFVRNLQDSCSPIALDIVDPALGRVASGAAVSVGAATSTVQIAAPAVDLGDVALGFGAPGPGQSGEITFQLSDSDSPASSGIGSLPWLLFDWDGDGDQDDDPGPRKVSFGHYRGHDRVIFWQENFSR